MSTPTISDERKIVHRHSHKAGLRTVAFVEALKGVLALLVAYTFIRMLRHDVDFENAAEHLLSFLHIGLQHHWSQELLIAADKLSDTRIATVLGLAIAYATLRFFEGYGLWKQRIWAEWLAIISGAIYIPVEVYKLARRPSQWHVGILTVNVLVVLYIAWVRWDETRSARAALDG